MSFQRGGLGLPEDSLLASAGLDATFASDSSWRRAPSASFAAESPAGLLPGRSSSHLQSDEFATVPRLSHGFGGNATGPSGWKWYESDASASSRTTSTQIVDTPTAVSSPHPGSTIRGVTSSPRAWYVQPPRLEGWLREYSGGANGPLRGSQRTEGGATFSAASSSVTVDQSTHAGRAHSTWHRVGDLEVQVEMQAARRARQKERHLATTERVVRSMQREMEECNARAAIGAWRYAVASGARSKARAAARAMNVRYAAQILATSFAQQQSRRLKSVISAWRLRTRVAARARLAVAALRRIGCLRIGPSGHARPYTAVQAVTLVVRAWRTYRVLSRASARDANAHAQNRELRLQLCELKNEVAGLECEAVVAETSSRQITAYTKRAISVLGSLINEPMPSDRHGAAPSLDTTQVVDEMPMMEKLERLLKMRETVCAKLSEAVQRATGTLQEAGASPPCRAPADEADMQKLRLAVASIAKLRSESSDLTHRIAAARGSAQAPHGLESICSQAHGGIAPPALNPGTAAIHGGTVADSEEIRNERAKTGELERRVAEAHLFVSTLRERHARMLEEAAKPTALPEVQRALSDLAKVSEELLTLK